MHCAAALLERDQLEAWERVGRLLKAGVSRSKRRQNAIDRSTAVQPSRMFASGREGTPDLRSRMHEMMMMPARSGRDTRAPHAIDGLLVESLGRLEHRMIGARTLGPRGGEQKQSCQLGCDLPQVLEMLSGFEDIGRRLIIYLARH